MKAKFLRFINRLIDWVLTKAKAEPSITLDEYRDLEKQANELRERTTK